MKENETNNTLVESVYAPEVAMKRVGLSCLTL